MLSSSRSMRFFSGIRNTTKALVCASALLLSERGADCGDPFVYAGDNREMLLNSREKNIKSAIERLDDSDPAKRYFALMDLQFFDKLSDSTIDKVIGYLDDFGGFTPGNTVACKAADLLGEHPEQAKKAIPQLLNLLGSKKNMGYPASSAAEALDSMRRQDIEQYISRLSADDKKQLEESLRPGLNGSKYPSIIMISEIMGMLGPSTNSLSSLESVFMEARSDKKSPSARILSARAEAAINIINAGAKVGDERYIEEMKKADKLLGKQDSYTQFGDGFRKDIMDLANKMKKAGVERAYLISQDEFPLQSFEGGLPAAMQITRRGFRYLYRGYDHRGKSLQEKPFVILTAASKEGFRDNHFPGYTPEYTPLVSDYYFVEMGVNGEPVLDKTLKDLGIKRGYDQGTWYEFWPSKKWDNVRRHLPHPISLDESVVWIAISDGQVANAGLTTKKKN